MKRRMIIVSAILTSFLAVALFTVRWFTTNQTKRVGTTPQAVLQDFAGEYYDGDGLGVNFYLSIQADKTFSFRASTDMGRRWEYTGTIVSSISLIQLISTERALFESHDLVPVKWGDRRYLIASDRISDFCEWVSKDWEPRKGKRGIFYLRINDWKIPVKGHPILPNGDLICP